VLTARHCVTDYGATTANTTIRLGSRYLGQGERHPVSAIQPNDQLDAALLELATPTRRADLTMPYGIGQVPAGDRVSVSGWGETELNPGHRSSVLRTAVLSRDPVNRGDNGDMTLNEVDGLPVLGDSGAGVVYRGAVCGVFRRSTTLERFA